MSRPRPVTARLGWTSTDFHRTILSRGEERETGVRRSIRVAVAAVAALIVPVLLAIIAVPAWLVVRAWPTMNAVDRGLFAAGALGLVLSVRPVIGRRLRPLFFGPFEAFTLFEQVVLCAPLVISWWAFSHDRELPG